MKNNIIHKNSKPHEFLIIEMYSELFIHDF